LLVIILNTQATLLHNYYLHHPPTKYTKFLKMALLALPGSALTTYPSKLGPIFFCSLPAGCTCTYCAPWLRLCCLYYYCQSLLNDNSPIESNKIKIIQNKINISD